ncbi:hypothetical protein Daus18300_003980 [Diaporthe australafricana]|uniref:Uncharacterized protein n=1 Tax=Diaporthe australafricana TaxID=127596 RepID=A0ABR3XBP3_9PEZI
MNLHSSVTAGQEQAPDHKWIGDTEDKDGNGVLKKYYRMKASDSLKYIEHLQSVPQPCPDLEKLQDDERRIEKTRARLSKIPSTKKLQGKLEASFKDWRDEPKDPKKTLIRYSWDQRKRHVKPDICPEPGKAATQVGDNDDPAHDFNASFMFFENDGQCWKGKTYHDHDFPSYEEFPNQRLSVHKALYDDSYNPFNVTQNDEGKRYLRYIHLPANHMGMPYLHWETSARRARIADTVKAVLKDEEAKRGPPKYRTKRSETIRQGMEKKYKNLFQDKELKNRELAKNMMKKPNVLSPNKLGQYLLDLAQLWEAMDMERDERLVRQGLVSRDTEGKLSEPVLHIRRTLDQSYFLNLTDTSQRDRDQVVYRATQGRENFTRVVMVDQLWLWVLDEHTIITSFSKRWGRNKPDSSGIHKSLRDRLAQNDCKIMSAWHLAFIIMDQCSNVFFDRTKPLDQRPEVMDIFAETLGNVNHWTTIAFDVFWQNVNEFNKNRDSRGSNRQSQRYLDINPEGILLREAQDISEELRIMIRIFSQQLGVVKSFQKCLEHMNGDPKTRTRPLHFTKFFQHFHDWTTERRTDALESDKKPVSLAEMDFLEDLVEEVEDRKSEIVDLETAALQTCLQLQELLSLKQQQASIVEAKAAIERADQSVEQGKAIMAFTIMTIIFTPLGFFTSFFGMNNSLTGAKWMSLWAQCLCMFLISAVIIICALSLAFKGSQIRRFMKSPIESTAEIFKGDGNKSACGEMPPKKTEMGQSTEMGVALDYFQAQRLTSTRRVKWGRRKNRPQQSVESSTSRSEKFQ